MFKNSSQIKNILTWLPSSRKPASTILTLLVEIVLEWVGENFIIQDPGRVKNLIKADLSALLYDIATERRETVTFAFFLNRIKRITLNLHQAGLLAPKRYFSEIEQSNPENNEFLDFFLENHGLSAEYVLIRPKKGQGKSENRRKNENKYNLKKKTLEKLRILGEIDEFYPGCIEEEVQVQKSLFDFVKEKKIVKERVKVKKAA